MGSPSHPEASSDELHLILIVQLFSPCPYQYSEMIKIKRGGKNQGLRILQLLQELRCGGFLSVALIGNLNHTTLPAIGSLIGYRT